MNSCRVGEVEAVEQDKGKKNFLEHALRELVEAGATAFAKVSDQKQSKGHKEHNANNE